MLNRKELVMVEGSYCKKQSGVVSLFVVIFSTLLITIVTVSFVTIMLKNQQSATQNDLSQSAYDSALAGVEDAKRALIRYQTICNSGDDAACATVASQINSSVCNEAVSGLKDVTTDGSEIEIETGGSNELDQAYTCTKINLNTEDYLGTLSADSSTFIALRGVSDFNTVQIEWYSSKDLGSTTDFGVNLGTLANLALLDQSSWPKNRPSILQTQFIQYSSNGLTLDDFESKNGSGESNSNTLFLYPTSSSVAGSPISATSDIRKTATGKPKAVYCSNSLSAGGYACTTKITLPSPINGGTRTAYLKLGAYYNNTDFRITLLSDNTAVKFSNVQPEIDSTGRTNDLFRRVKARVDLTDVDFPYPNAAVSLAGSLCKDFIVTDSLDDYQDNTAGCK